MRSNLGLITNRDTLSTGQPGSEDPCELNRITRPRDSLVLNLFGVVKLMELGIDQVTFN